ncbi:MAG TPA: FixH family protein [Roseiflexaceae bacterium]|nr:FixH family protein [Roseiflexaceae bacterium]
MQLRAGVSLRLFVAWVALAALLAACGAPVQTAQTERYTITLRLEGAGIGERTATVELADHQGRPVTADQVVIAPVMRDMGMAAPEVVAQPSGPGRYSARAPLFSMPGAWDVDVRVAAGGVEETVTFTLHVE